MMLLFKRFEEFVPPDVNQVVLLNTIETHIHHGTFVLYDESAENGPSVGRIIDHVASIDAIPHNEQNEVIGSVVSETDNAKPGSYIKLHCFPVLTDGLRQSNNISVINVRDDQRLSSVDGMPEVYESFYYVWVQESIIFDIAFVFHKESIVSEDYNCRGMTNGFFIRYSLPPNSEKHEIDKACFIDFPDKFPNFLCGGESYASRIWQQLKGVRDEIQRGLNSRAQAQSDFCTKSVKLKGANKETWHYIVRRLQRTDAITGVRNLLDTHTNKRRALDAYRSGGIIKVFLANLLVFVLRPTLRSSKSRKAIQRMSFKLKDEGAIETLHDLLGDGVTIGSRQCKPRVNDGVCDERQINNAFNCIVSDASSLHPGAEFFWDKETGLTIRMAYKRILLQNTNGTGSWCWPRLKMFLLGALSLPTAAPALFLEEEQPPQQKDRRARVVIPGALFDHNDVSCKVISVQNDSVCAACCDHQDQQFVLPYNTVYQAILAKLGID